MEMNVSSNEDKNVMTIELSGRAISYRLCRVLPDTALVLLDVMKEAERLWGMKLGEQSYLELRGSAEGDAFFAAEVRLETVPPNREVLAVRLPFPPDFARLIKPQVVDYVEEATAP
jgi:hypothetical protein